MINVVCVKTGTKYEPEFVNRLYRMVKKNLSLPFDFYCLTETPDNINPEINILDISDEVESGVDGFWPKLCIFNPKLYKQNSNTLFLDLDVVIQNNIDYFFQDVNPERIKICYGDNDSLLMENDIRNNMNYFTKVNSSVMIFNSSKLNEIYKHFEQNPYLIMKEYRGVCRYLWNVHQEKLEYLQILKDYYHVGGIPAKLAKDPSWRHGAQKFKIYSESFGGSFKGYHLSEPAIAIFNGNAKDLFLDSDNIFSCYYK